MFFYGHKQIMCRVEVEYDNTLHVLSYQAIKTQEVTHKKFTSTKNISLFLRYRVE